MTRWLVLALLVCGSLAAPPDAGGQAAARVYRVGILAVPARATASDRTSAAARLTLALRKLGYVEGPNLHLEQRFAGGQHQWLAGLARELVLASPILNRDRARIIELAARHRLPAIYQWREHAEEGGLIAYGSSAEALLRRMAAYIDRILKGARPAELPVEQPTVYELIVNLKTARALGLTLPQTLLLRADEVIQ